MTETGCLTRVRRKFHELWDPHKNPVGEQAPKCYEVT